MAKGTDDGIVRLSTEYLALLRTGKFIVGSTDDERGTFRLHLQTEYLLEVSCQHRKSTSKYRFRYSTEDILQEELREPAVLNLPT